MVLLMLMKLIQEIRDTDDLFNDGDEVGDNPAEPIDTDGDGKIDALEDNRTGAHLNADVN